MTGWVLAVLILMGMTLPAVAEDRVAAARRDKEAVVQSLCAKAGVSYPPKRLFLRAFKQERVLEVWGANAASDPMRLIRAYKIAAASGGLGPKRIEGDAQVPEGFYAIDRFNPASQFLLSMRVNYPNASDRILSDKLRPGGDIYIHGNRLSIGCMAMTDDKIKEIYLLALGAKGSGQREIPIHIFPCRLTPRGVANLAATYASRPDFLALWKVMQKGYQAFEDTHRVPSVRVREDGYYEVRKAR